jgi:O-antigen ligase
MALAGSASRERRLLAISVSLVAVGIALSVSQLQTLGSWLTVGSLIAVIVALHKLGRSGPT